MCWCFFIRADFVVAGAGVVVGERVGDYFDNYFCGFGLFFDSETIIRFWLEFLIFCWILAAFFCAWTEGKRKMSE